MAKRARRLFALLLIVLGASTGVATLLARPQSPPKGELRPRSQRIVSPYGSGDVEAIYEIKNLGDQDLMLGRSETSCGCSVASIEPRVIAAGGTGLLKVKGSPPSSGEKEVEIRVETNDPVHPSIVAKLVMVGTRPVPYITFTSGPVNFGPIRSGQEPEQVVVETRERGSDPPWITGAVVMTDVLKVNGSLARESDVGGGLVLRRYEYRVAVETIPKQVGEASNRLQLRTWDNQEIAGLPISFRVRNPVVAAPSTLLCSEGDQVAVTFSSDDPSFDLKISPDPGNSSDFLVERSGDHPSATVFSVKTRSPREPSFRSNLTFRTNHPEMPVVRVPIVVRARAASIPANEGTR